MHRKVTLALLTTFVATALAIGVNVATSGTLPGTLARYNGWAWPAVAILTVVAGVIAVVQLWSDTEAKPHEGPLRPLLPTPAELPADIADFTGRAQVVGLVRELVENTTSKRSTAVVISAITGMAGIGKTALAVHVAHLARARFPDGQFSVNLRGAEAQALEPTAVLGDFLLQLGMVDLPEDLDGRVRAYRSRVAGKRVLVVLDNAADEEQVRPLLPGSPSCAVLITSRARLLGLAGARLIVLDVLPDDEAVELLGQMIGQSRIAAERDHAEEIVRRCGRLPIAIRIAGAVLTKWPHESLARFAGQLKDERALDVLSAKGSDDVRVGFSLSYRNLAPEDQRLFRLLGLLSAPDFPAWAGDAALGNPTGRGRRTPLGRLVDAQLIEDDRGLDDLAGQRRYRFHDLLREFARERLDATETAAARMEALERILVKYLLLSRNASRLLRPVDTGALPAYEPASFGEDPFRNGALNWFMAEHASLVAAVEQAGQAGLGTLAWQLSLSLEAFFERRAHWDAWHDTCELALAATRAAGDPVGEAQILRSMGYLARERGNPGRSLRFLEQSLRGFRALDDRAGEAHVTCNMIRTYRDLGLFHKASGCYQRALPIARSLGNSWLEANIERDMGMVHRDHGVAAEALACLGKAMKLFQNCGDELLEAYTLRDIGLVYQQQGRSDAAVPRFQEALSGFESLGDQRGAARALNSLGVGYGQQHQWHEAVTCFRRSLDVFRELGDRRWEAYTLRSLGELHREQALALRGRGIVLRLGRRVLERSHWRRAEDRLHESRNILDDLKDQPWEAQTLLSLGEVYAGQCRWNEAIGCLDAALTVFRKIGNRNGQATAQALLDQAATARGDRTSEREEKEETR